MGVCGKLGGGLEGSSLLEDTDTVFVGAAFNTVVEPITGMVFALILGRLAGSVILCFGGKGDMYRGLLIFFGKFNSISCNKNKYTYKI